MYNSFHFGTVLKETRLEQRLSQKKLAADICSQAMLSRIENNEVIPSVILMKQLCDRLEVSLDFILGTEYELSNNQSEDSNEWLELLKFYHQSTQYQQLKRIMEETNVFKTLTTNKQQQEYYFYQACCQYFFNPYDQSSLKTLKKSLNFTYSNQKQHLSDMEIIILSEIGKITANQGNVTLGMSYLKRSMNAFYNQTKQRHDNQLAKVFYNIATIYIDLRNYKEALSIINQGISWSSRLKNYYFLDELFLLKGIVLQDHELIDDAIKFVQVAETLKSIAHDGRSLNEKRLRHSPKNTGPLD